MKIYYPLLCYYPSQAGGPANSIFWINEELANVGYSCVVTSTFFGLNSSTSLDPKIYNSANKIKFVSNSLKFISFTELKKVLSVDIIHFSSLFFKPTLPLLLFALLFGKKVAISPRGELFPDALAKSKRVKLIYLYFLKPISKQLKFHATSDSEKKLILSYFPQNKGVYTIPNFINVEKLHSIDQQNQVLFLGRINEIKNIHLIVKAMDLLKNSKLSYPKLIIAGKAEIDSEIQYLRKLENEIHALGLVKDIVFVGQVEGEQKMNLFQESLCTILPSKSENFGNVVLESLMVGTPVIASKGTPWEVMNKKKIGFWIDATPDGIAEKISKIIEMESGSYSLMRSRARLFVEEEFDIQKNINMWTEFYN